ncbi:hypothetical protein P3T73_03260 [Kiritimatiellota bacterium B12222]|nr:hypothetical protein P3T73_03260 [Kiritimatiellota bacterium B12222]
MRQTLGWKEIDEDGRKLEVEAFRERNHWTFTKRLNRRHDWETIEEPSVADWEQLMDLIDRKYRRRRCAYRDVEQVKEFLEEAKKKETGL